MGKNRVTIQLTVYFFKNYINHNSGQSILSVTMSEQQVKQGLSW